MHASRSTASQPVPRGDDLAALTLPPRTDPAAADAGEGIAASPDEAPDVSARRLALRLDALNADSSRSAAQAREKAEILRSLRRLPPSAIAALLEYVDQEDVPDSTRREVEGVIVHILETHPEATAAVRQYAFTLEGRSLERFLEVCLQVDPSRMAPERRAELFTFIRALQSGRGLEGTFTVPDNVEALFERAIESWNPEPFRHPPYTVRGARPQRTGSTWDAPPTAAELRLIYGEILHAAAHRDQPQLLAVVKGWICDAPVNPELRWEGGLRFRVERTPMGREGYRDFVASYRQSRGLAPNAPIADPMDLLTYFGERYPELYAPVLYEVWHSMTRDHPLRAMSAGNQLLPKALAAEGVSLSDFLRDSRYSVAHRAAVLQTPSVEAFFAGKPAETRTREVVALLSAIDTLPPELRPHLLGYASRLIQSRLPDQELRPLVQAYVRCLEHQLRSGDRQQVTAAIEAIQQLGATSRPVAALGDGNSAAGADRLSGLLLDTLGLHPDRETRLLVTAALTETRLTARCSPVVKARVLECMRSFAADREQPTDLRAAAFQVYLANAEPAASIELLRGCRRDPALPELLQVVLLESGGALQLSPSQDDTRVLDYVYGEIAADPALRDAMRGSALYRDRELASEYLILLAEKHPEKLEAELRALRRNAPDYETALSIERRFIRALIEHRSGSMEAAEYRLLLPLVLEQIDSQIALGNGAFRVLALGTLLSSVTHLLENRPDLLADRATGDFLTRAIELLTELKRQPGIDNEEAAELEARINDLRALQAPRK